MAVALNTLFLFLVVFGILLTVFTITLVAKEKHREELHRYFHRVGQGTVVITAETETAMTPSSSAISFPTLRTWKEHSQTLGQIRRRIRRRDDVISIFSTRSSENDYTENTRGSRKDGDTTADRHRHLQQSITPIQCRDVRSQVQSKKWEDPNHGTILARNIISKPQFAISVHVQEYDRVRYSSIYVKGDYYEKKVRNRFIHILNEQQNDYRNEKSGKTTTPLVIDIGGNIGYYTLLSASFKLKVVTFEINPANLIRLCESIQLNLDRNDGEAISVKDVKPLEDGRIITDTSVSIYRYAVSNQQGQSLLVDIPKRNPGEAHVVGEAVDSDPDAGNDTDTDTKEPKAIEDQIATLRHAQVSTITLDAFATQQGWIGGADVQSDSKSQSKPLISILKIDTEGHEPQIIEGSKKLLMSGLVKNVLMEYRPATCRNAVDTLLDAGYGIVYENMDRRILTLLGREASESYLDPYRAGAAAHAKDPRKGISTNVRRQAKRSSLTINGATDLTSTTTKTEADLEEGYEDLWFRLLSNPLPPSAVQSYWAGYVG